MALFKEMKIPNIYTMESSFCGNDQGPLKGKHFTQADLCSVGRDLCRSLLLYSGIAVPDSFNPEDGATDANVMPSKKFTEDTLEIKSQLLKELTGDENLITNGEGSSSSGSDDAPSEDNMEAE